MVSAPAASTAFICSCKWQKRLCPFSNITPLICTPKLVIFSMERLHWTSSTDSVNYERSARAKKQERLCRCAGWESHTENSWDSVKHSFTAACTRLMDFSRFHEYQAPSFRETSQKQIVLAKLKLLWSKLLPLRDWKMCKDLHTYVSFSTRLLLLCMATRWQNSPITFRMFFHTSWICWI